MNYDWLSVLTTLGVAIVTVVFIRLIAFRHAGVKQMVELNHVADESKMKRKRYKTAIDKSKKLGLYMNLGILLLVVPFATTLSTVMPWWRYVADVVVMLLFYDFFYYLMHRFLFHGKGYFFKVHSLHHQSREPSHMDAYFVHPVETAMGLVLFALSIIFTAIVMGPVHSVSMAAVLVIFTQVSILNHTILTVDSFPFRIVSYLSSKHHVHHENMWSGNYSGITVLFDWMFGTLDVSSKETAAPNTTSEA